MIVVNVSNVPLRLRGYLTKYLWEINTGIYVGNVNARIREALWKKIKDYAESGRATMVFPSDNEQGFDFYTLDSAWEPIDFEGLKLILHRREEALFESSKKRSQIPDTYIVLDLETTGLDVENDRILEIGAIRVVSGKETERFNRLINVKVPNEIAVLTGITQDMADGGVEVKTALEKLGKFIADDITVGFNIRKFDIRIIRRECVRNKVSVPIKQMEDVLEIVKRKYPGLKTFRLKDVADYFQISTDGRTHRALVDCVLCNEVYKDCFADRNEI